MVGKGSSIALILFYADAWFFLNELFVYLYMLAQQSVNSLVFSAGVCVNFSMAFAYFIVALIGSELSNCPPENVNKIWAVVSKAKISITPSTPTYELEGWGIPCQPPSWCLRFWPAKHPGTFLHWEILRSWEDWNTSVSSPVLTWLSSTVGFNT